MSRYDRKTIITARLEPTYGAGLNGGSWNADDAIQCSTVPRFRPVRDNVQRELVREHFGNSEELPATRRGDITATVELAGSGTPGTAPPWGKLLRACGFAETIDPGNTVTYTPITDDPESLVMRYVRDGARYFIKGVRGNVQIMLPAFGIPKLEFTFSGFDRAAATVGNIGADLSAWQRPTVLTSETAGDAKFGAALLASGALDNSGSNFNHLGLDINVGNQIEHHKVIGNESIGLVDRKTTGTLRLELDAASEVQLWDDANSGALTSAGMRFGTTAGHRITVFAPSVQRVNPDVEESDGLAISSVPLIINPVNGNDELRIVCA